MTKRRAPKAALKAALVVGARPNFMKIAPVYREMKEYPDDFEPVLVHTGQHYDRNMSDLFFRDLDLPEPDVYLGVGSASHAVQTAKVMIAFEKFLDDARPDLVVVVGDVNSTLACAVVSSKALVPTAHIEAGLRSFDRTMPEEINRVVTDHLCDLLFTTCRDADENLHREGINAGKIHFVGNVMIDTLLSLKEKSRASDVLETLGVKEKEYSVLTLHRPGNVDDKKTLAGIFDGLERIGSSHRIIFPAHPRTVKQLSSFGISCGGVTVTEPLGYLDFLRLITDARMVLTDSGGIQEETTALGVPCLTIRNNTERPVTVTEGTNVLVGNDPDRIVEEAAGILQGGGKRGGVPRLWDGNASRRIISILRERS